MTLLLDQPVLDALVSELRGEVIGPNHADYNDVRKVHNGMIDKRPAVIARCTGVADVMTALQFGRDQDLPIAVRGGGHNVAGTAVCNDGIVIDLSPMKGMRVDSESRTARAQAGLTWGEFDRETHAFGLATTGGVVSTTGIAGLTLGGGIGWLQRKHGLTCDNLLSADLVTADGRFLTASKTAYSDLFWGLRGGGGNFGVVTSFEYRLHPVDQVVAGPVLHPFSAAEDLFRFHREFAAEAPDDAYVEFALGPLPDGQPGAFLFLFHAGPPEVGEKVLRRAREFGSPLEDYVETMPYPAAQQLFDADFPPGVLNFWKSSNLHELTDDVIETLVAFYERAPVDGTFVVIDQFGGAVSRVPDDATAFGHREAAYDLVLASRWTDPVESEQRIDWTRSLWDAMQPHTVESVYVNYLGDEGEERVRAAYGDEHFERLVALKRNYDPENVFRGNQNIKP